jgi:hypothetical protein
MSVSFQGNSPDTRVVAGDQLVLRIKAYDPAGISRIMVQCFQFSMATSTRAKMAIAETGLIQAEDCFAAAFDIAIPIPENAALGKWGVQMVEFTNSRGYKTAFYRGQDKFDNVVFEVVAPASKEDELLCFQGVDIPRRPGRPGSS